MRLVVVVLLGSLCAFGFFLLDWHRVAGGGFGLGIVNTPRLLRSPSRSRVVWIAGQVALWGGLFGLLGSRWYEFAPTVFLAGGIEKVAFFLAFREEIVDAKRELHRHSQSLPRHQGT